MNLSKNFFFLITLHTILYAQTLTQKELEALASDKTWRNLLHYEKQTGKSAILTQAFFLSENGESDPQEELRATIDGYDQPFSKNPDKHPRCRYPARYLWLSRKIPLDGYEKIPKECKRLDAWELPQNAHSISVVFVSGFLGNPASAFGHSFIKVNEEGDDHAMNDLMNTTISYGAILPEKYSMTSYIFNGITGGYRAKYSDKYYYMDAMVYSNSEFREMWDYELKLSSFQKDLLLLHFWELSDREFGYYFFNRNCGYKVSELLEMVYEEDVIDHAQVWYAPVETFHKIEEMNQAHEIIDEIRYIPSAQQQVYAKYKGLNEREKEIVETMIGNALTSIPKADDNISTLSKVKIIDFVLLFHQYKYPTEDKKYTEEALRERQELMISRLALPIMDYNETLPIQKPPISQSVKTSLIALSGIKREKRESVVLRFSPFIIEKLGDNHLDGDHLAILDTELAFEKGSILLRRLDAVNILRLKTQEISFDTDNPFSWSLRVGTEKVVKRDYLVDGGIGYAWNLHRQVKGYLMLNASLHTVEEHYRYRPNAGIYAKFGKLRMDASYSIERDIHGRVDNRYYEAGLQYRIEENASLYIEADNRYETTLKAGLKWHF
ncbi:MAG: DUF4105 domain-containing protein [Sulfurovum sp.]|jgi:hypothetical protein|nr:DUF4105 domain-containing protein [Sulfurovum sp.]